MWFIVFVVSLFGTFYLIAGMLGEEWQQRAWASDTCSTRLIIAVCDGGPGYWFAFAIGCAARPYGSSRGEGVMPE
jgi:hypothetical protein